MRFNCLTLPDCLYSLSGIDTWLSALTYLNTLGNLGSANCLTLPDCLYSLSGIDTWLSALTYLNTLGNLGSANCVSHFLIVYIA